MAFPNGLVAIPDGLSSVDGLVQIQFTHFHLSFPAEQKQLAGERGGTLRGLADLRGKTQLHRVKITLGLQQIRLHLDDAKNVVGVI
jgi:hypothetical protein